MKELLNFLMNILVLPFMFVEAFLTGWLLWLAWNNGLVEVFNNVPPVTYWQSYWLSLLAGLFFRRQIMFLDKDD